MEIWNNIIINRLTITVYKINEKENKNVKPSMNKDKQKYENRLYCMYKPAARIR